jgi:hypothetical protein
MAISMASLRRGGENKPPRCVLYGPHGVGKTSIAACAPNPVFLQTEDGLAEIDVPTFGMLRSFDNVMEAIGTLYTDAHDFQTVVLDTIDWLEPLVWAEASRRNSWESIEAAGYGKGYLAAVDVWREVIDGTNALRDDKGMMVILLAHADIKRFESPEVDPYDRYQPKLHSRASALVQENVDCVFFNQRMVSTVKIDPKDKTSNRVRGVGGGQRAIYTEERPAFLAKNRYRMPPMVILPDDPGKAWDALAVHLPYFNQPLAKAA